MRDSIACRVLVVDDEPPARRRLVRLLQGRPGVEILAECGDGREAVEAIRNQAPDLVFLDIQMPELDGFGVLRELDGEHLPEVIFVTAYDQYALEAFEVHALDYLLKPYEDERFGECLDRALERLRERQSDRAYARITDLLRVFEGRTRGASAAEPPLRRLAIEKNGRLFLLPLTQVLWIEAAGASVRVHTRQGSHLLRDTLKRLESVLPNFVRIHRSTLVNRDRVRELRPLFRGEHEVVLDEGTCLKLSRRFRDRLPDLLR